MPSKIGAVAGSLHVDSEHSDVKHPGVWTAIVFTFRQA